jgi:hypothetical protein
LLFFVVFLDFVAEFLEGEVAFCADRVLLAEDCIEGLEFFVKVGDLGSFTIQLGRKTGVEVLAVSTS